MKKLILVLAFMPFALVGQSLGAYESKLGDAAAGAYIDVEEVGMAATILDSIPAGHIRRTVDVYRVEIFSDNTANARARAYEAYAKFRELCPDIPTDLSRDIRYDSPKYTVRVGSFLTHDEALILVGRLKNVFKAYPRTDQMPLSTFAGR